MKYTLVVIGLGLLFSGCAVLGPRTHTLTINNKNCLLDATVFLDGKNSGKISRGQAKNFTLDEGIHKWNVDNDLPGDAEINMNQDRTVEIVNCL